MSVKGELRMTMANVHREDSHTLKVYEEHGGYAALRKALAELGFTRAHGGERLSVYRGDTVTKLTVWSRGLTLTGSEVGRMLEDGTIPVLSPPTLEMLKRNGLTFSERAEGSNVVAIAERRKSDDSPI